MASAIFRCPTTGMNVQGWLSDDVAVKAEAASYSAMRCAACAQVHLVDPETGKVLGNDKNMKFPRSE